MKHWIIFIFIITLGIKVRKRTLEIHATIGQNNTDMPKKFKDVLRDPAESRNLFIDFWDISVMSLDTRSRRHWRATQPIANGDHGRDGDLAQKHVVGEPKSRQG